MGVEHAHHFVPRPAGKGAQVLRCACGLDLAQYDEARP